MPGGAGVMLEALEGEFARRDRVTLIPVRVCATSDRTRETILNPERSGERARLTRDRATRSCTARPAVIVDTRNSSTHAEVRAAAVVYARDDPRKPSRNAVEVVLLSV